MGVPPHWRRPVMIDADVSDGPGCFWTLVGLILLLAVIACCVGAVDWWLS